MNVLIVESKPELGEIWAAHLRRRGASVTCSNSQQMATEHIQACELDIIILDLMLDQGSALAIADYASYARPRARVVFVTNSSFFSDGSIFQHVPNACAFLPMATSPDDLAAVVDHYGVTN